MYVSKLIIMWRDAANASYEVRLDLLTRSFWWFLFISTTAWSTGEGVVEQSSSFGSNYVSKSSCVTTFLFHLKINSQSSASDYTWERVRNNRGFTITSFLLALRLYLRNKKTTKRNLHLCPCTGSEAFTGWAAQDCLHQCFTNKRLVSSYMCTLQPN